MYRISGNFSDDLFFAFFVISFELQTTNKCSEIIFCIIFYKKLAKNDCSKLKMLHVFPIFANLCYMKKTGYTVYTFNNTDFWCELILFQVVLDTNSLTSCLQSLFNTNRINITLISLANISMGMEVNTCHPSVATSHFPEVRRERKRERENRNEKTLKNEKT